MSGGEPNLWRAFRIPLLLATLSLVGLVGALLDDGLWDTAGAALLALTLVIAGLAWHRRRNTPSSGRGTVSDGSG